MVHTPAILAVTMGEPAGIGPDVIIMASKLKNAMLPVNLCVIGCAQTLRTRAAQLGINPDFILSVASLDEAHTLSADRLPVLDRPLPDLPTPGILSCKTSAHVINWIDEAVQLAMAGKVSGFVTGPIQKETLYQAGFTHQGHTDYIAHLARQAGHDAKPVMMLSAGSFRTVPLTVHIPLDQVAASITTGEIITQANIIDHDLKKYFGIAAPRIAIAGLNPHAGENRTIGTQDADIIAPAVKTLNNNGLRVHGPVSADTMFHEEARAAYDCALCMYHDQALIPIKTIGFHDGINTTLGLPFVRTSPDHGTALNLAGTGKANPSSFIAAIKQAAKMASALT